MGTKGKIVVSHANIAAESIICFFWLRINLRWNAAQDPINIGLLTNCFHVKYLLASTSYCTGVGCTNWWHFCIHSDIIAGVSHTELAGVGFSLNCFHVTSFVCYNTCLPHCSIPQGREFVNFGVWVHMEACVGEGRALTLDPQDE